MTDDELFEILQNNTILWANAFSELQRRMKELREIEWQYKELCK